MSAAVSLNHEVIEKLPWLFAELGFRVVQDHFDPANFGNSFVTLESPGLWVRFVRDRGQIFAEVASRSEPETWWNLEHVCELATGRSVDPGFELSAIASLLRSSVSALTDCLGSNFPETKRELEMRAEGRKQAFFKRLSR